MVPAAAPVRGRPPVPGMRGRNAPKPGEAGQFKEVGGHHIHAKSGFRGHPTYDPERGFSISEAYMARRGWEHPKMTAVQQKMFRELEKRGLPNTMRAHSRIAREALVKAGATRAEATALVRASLRQMRLDMVKAPTRIPWGKKGR